MIAPHNVGLVQYLFVLHDETSHAYHCGVARVHQRRVARTCVRTMRCSHPLSTFLEYCIGMNAVSG